MWSSKFLLAYTLQKLNREKRERQPNWTESEKQLLLSLTRMHQPILENKGSDTMTIKRKSEAWDEIALRMNAAGYNRSKERLKQQLGRIRAAEAKKIKDAIERNLSAEQVKNFNISANNLPIDDCVKPLYPVRNEFQDQIHNSSVESLSLSCQEELYIKLEETPTVSEVENTKIEIPTNLSDNLKNNIIDSSILNTSREEGINGTTKIMDDMHFRVQNVQSLAKTDDINDVDLNEENYVNISDVANAVPTMHSESFDIVSTRNNERNRHIVHENENNFTSSICAKASNRKTERQKRNRFRRIRYSGIHIPPTREQRLRQLHLYRIAVERERLRSLKLQQKRDRILYRKDVEIQNLKLQILRNLTNQNRDTNGINL